MSTAPVHEVPDPVQVTATRASLGAFRQKFGLASDVHWFAVVGHVSARKNLTMVARAVAAVPDAKVGLLIAGQVDQGVLTEADPVLRAMVERRSGSVVIVNDVLSNQDLDNAVGVADTVVLAYSDVGPSGILGKAAALGTSVLAAGSPMLRREVERLDLGTWVDLTQDALDLGAREAMSHPSPPVRPMAGPKQFAEVLLRGLAP